MSTKFSTAISTALSTDAEAGWYNSSACPLAASRAGSLSRLPPGPQGNARKEGRHCMTKESTDWPLNYSSTGSYGRLREPHAVQSNPSPWRSCLTAPRGPWANRGFHRESRKRPLLITLGGRLRCSELDHASAGPQRTIVLDLLGDSRPYGPSWSSLLRRRLELVHWRSSCDWPVRWP